MLIPLLLSLIPLIQDPPKPVPPDPEKVKAAVAQLTEALSKPEVGTRLRAIESCAEIADAEVVRLIARGLSDKDSAVRGAAVEALRFNEHKKALDELHGRAKVKAAKEDVLGYAGLMRAIGQHGDPGSLEILADNPWSIQDAGVLEARILGISRIRTKEAVKALTDLMEMGGQGKVQPFMKDFRVAMWALTGADQGASRDLWLAWYRDNKAKLEVRPAPATEPRELAQRWSRYWAKDGDEQAPPEKGKRRRGGDGPPPEKGKDPPTAGG